MRLALIFAFFTFPVTFGSFSKLQPSDEVTSPIDADSFLLEADSHEIPKLPSPEANESPHQFALGETISLDHLGPIIVNADGTLRRIANWDSLTQGERESAIRQISRRNKKRLEALQSHDRENDEVTA
jgi:hypothetical protein